MKQKIENLKVRRRRERINLMLTSASRGDLLGLNHMFQVRDQILQIAKFALILLCLCRMKLGLTLKIRLEGLCYMLLPQRGR